MAVAEGCTMKRVPSFSARPNFPKGLEVLVLNRDASEASEVERLLQQHSYVATCCSSCGEAVEQLSTSSGQFDVVLAEAMLLSVEGPDVAAFLAAASKLPLVLLCEGSGAAEVLKGIKLGAVDFLQKPVSSLKLKNIWQHVVRKLMDNMTVGDKVDEGKIKEESQTTSCVIKKSESVAPSLPGPKTPSPAASGAEVGCSIATSNSNSESACSEGRKDNCEEGSDWSDATKCASASLASASLKSNGSSDDKSRSAAKCRKPATKELAAAASSAANRPPLAMKMPACSVYTSMPAYGAPGMFMMNTGWGAPTGPCMLPAGGSIMGSAAGMAGCGMVAGPGMSLPYTPACGYGMMPPGFVPVPGPNGAMSPFQGPGLASYPQPVGLQGCAATAGFGLGSSPPLQLNVEEARTRAPIGLQLTKSASLVNLINEQLSQQAF